MIAEVVGSNPTPATTPMFTVVVCGAPGSGNHLVTAHLQRSGINSFTRHPNTRAWRADFDNDGRPIDAAVVPIRLDELARQGSAKRRGGGFSLTEEWRIVAWRQIAELGIPRYPVFFEEIIRTGGAALDDVIRALGYAPAPWPDDRSPPLRPEYGRVLTEAERRDLPTRERKLPDSYVPLGVDSGPATRPEYG